MRWLVAALLAIAVLAPGPAGAHVELLEAEPPADGEVTEGLEEIVLTVAAFDTEAPVDVEVTDPTGTDVTAGEPVVDAEASTITVPVRPLAEGQHIVHWHATADDGDGASEGTYTFTVVDAPGGGVGIWLIWLLALGIPAAILLRPGARSSKP